MWPNYVQHPPFERVSEDLSNSLRRRKVHAVIVRVSVSSDLSSGVRQTRHQCDALVRLCHANGARPGIVNGLANRNVSGIARGTVIETFGPSLRVH